MYNVYEGSWSDFTQVTTAPLYNPKTLKDKSWKQHPNFQHRDKLIIPVLKVNMHGTNNSQIAKTTNTILWRVLSGTIPPNILSTWDFSDHNLFGSTNGNRDKNGKDILQSLVWTGGTWTSELLSSFVNPLVGHPLHPDQDRASRMPSVVDAVPILVKVVPKCRCALVKV